MKDGKLRGRIEKAIIDQLKETHKYEYAHYQDLVNDYMKMWDFKTMLQEDIIERGVSVHWNNGGGQEGYKKNDSVGELLKVTTQMLKILYDLGIRAMDLKVVDEDEGII